MLLTFWLKLDISLTQKGFLAHPTRPWYRRLRAFDTGGHSNLLEGRLVRAVVRLGQELTLLNWMWYPSGCSGKLEA